MISKPVRRRRHDRGDCQGLDEASRTSALTENTAVQRGSRMPLVFIAVNVFSGTFSETENADHA
jgi:hypothetical protein